MSDLQQIDSTGTDIPSATVIAHSNDIATADSEGKKVWERLADEILGRIIVFVCIGILVRREKLKRFWLYIS